MNSNLLYFPSGSNRVCDFIGFLDAQMAPGVTVSEIGDAEFSQEESLEMLIEGCLENNIPVFVDSGAFSEVEFQPGRGLVPVRPIDDSEWKHRLDIYKKIAERLGNLAYLVAPDQVGNQEVTLARLAQYKEDVQDLIAYGANVMIVLQGGDQDLDSFRQAALDALDVAHNDVMIALPMAKGATQDDKIIELLEAYQPQTLHLLGLGPNSRRLADVVSIIEDLAPACLISHDSCYIRQHAGYKDRAKSNPKALTGARMEAIDDLHFFANREAPYGEIGYLARLRGDYTDLIGSPSQWITRAGLRRVKDEMNLDRSEVRRFYADPDEFLQNEIPGTDIYYYEDPLVMIALEREWEKHHDDAMVPCKQYQGIVRAFDTDSPLHCEVPANRRKVRRYIKEESHVEIFNRQSGQGYAYEIQADHQAGKYLVLSGEQIICVIVGDECQVIEDKRVAQAVIDGRVIAREVEVKEAVAFKWVWDHADNLPGQVEIF